MKTPAMPRMPLADGGEEQPIVGDSPVMQEVRAYIARVASTESNVLITGETGTGKELVAEQIHRHSARYRKPFVCVNCTAVPDGLLESELFGYERGAFTGATTLSRGKFELADGGTLFLDEIGDMSPYAQAKILRAVDGKEVHRLGGQRGIPLNTRIIAATNQDLEHLVAANQFRRDLYFRLNVARIHLPPLRERKQDLMPLCQHYFHLLSEQLGRGLKGFTADVYAYLLHYDWPGNVRELRNLVEAVFIRCDSPAVSFIDLPELLRARLGEARGLPVGEQDRLLSALLSTNWNKSKAALKLQWSRMTLYRKLEKYHIAVPAMNPLQSLSKNYQGSPPCDASPGKRLRRRRGVRVERPPQQTLWELPDALWRRLEPLIPAKKSPAGHPRTVDLRRITEGIFWVLRTGTPWQACPRERFGPPSTVYYYFAQWVKAGVFGQLWAEARPFCNDLEDAEWTWRRMEHSNTPAPLEE
jgi:transcriptional regulator with AAA-type ATPase domain/transposase